MHVFGELWRRLLFLFRQRRFHRDLDEEMRFHLEMKSTAQGPLAARRQFGNATLWQETSREAWGWMAAGRLAQDVRYGVRSLSKSPGFTAAVVVTLALGIGVNTAIFSFVDRLLLRPLPFPHSERLATLYRHWPNDPRPWSSLSYPDYLFFRDHNQIFSGLAAYTEDTVGLRFGAETETVACGLVTANYFDVLGVAPVLGRTFAPREDIAPGRNPVAMISTELWKRRFAGDPAAIGRQVTLNTTSFTVIGIVPPRFGGLELDRSTRPAIWVPTMMYPAVEPYGNQWDLQHIWGDEWLSATGRLKPGVTMEQATANIAQLTMSLKALWSAAKLKKDVTGLVIAANQARFPPDRRQDATTLFAMLMAVVGLVLLIACSNVASLMLARGVKRQREIGVRLALGAGRWRLAQQLLTEGLLISLMGGAAGLAVAVLTARALASFSLFGMQNAAPGGLDGRVLAFALAISTAAGLIFGLIPLRQALRPALLRTFGMRNALVAVQVALSVILLAGAGLFVRTLRNAQATDPTHSPEQVLLVNLDQAARKHQDMRFFDNLHDRLHALPGVQSAAYVMVVPFGGRRGGTDIIAHLGDRPAQVDFNRVSSEYFRTVGLPVIRGRDFNDRDRAGAPLVAIVNEQAARRFWPGEDPIGKQIQVWPNWSSAQIIGVVRDGRFRGYRSEVNPCYYVPLAQQYIPLVSLEVRVAGDPSGLAPAIRREIQGMDRDLALPEIQTLRSFRDAGMAQERLQAALLSGLGLLALAIAAVGLYGVLAFAVAQRTREIGIRMALGAAAGQVVRGVLRQALALIGAGLAIGMAAVLPLAKLIAGLLYGVTGADPTSYAAAAAILLLVGALAAVAPARRAAHVDPALALRHE